MIPAHESDPGYCKRDPSVVYWNYESDRAVLWRGDSGRLGWPFSGVSLHSVVWLKYDRSDMNEALWATVGSRSRYLRDVERNAGSALSVCVSWSFVITPKVSGDFHIGVLRAGPKRSALGVERGGSHERDEEGSSVSLGTPRS